MRCKRTQHGSRRGGFTLVELLVSTGLVMLMLVMFATIFQIATGALSTQRGIAENDQRARTLTTMLHNDINYRTFRYVVPFAPDEIGATDRRGYLYISENSPDDDRNDVLALTVEVPGDVPLFGRAGHLFYDDANGDGLPYQDTNGNGRYDSGEPLDNIYGNQQEMDGDGDFENATATLTTAEVVYFLRGGNLYRRVMLIRRGRGGAEQPQDDSSPPNELFDPTLPQSGGGIPYSGVFYNDFDYSVYAIDNGGQIRVQFHGEDSLDNVPAIAGSPTFFQIGKPQYRFGHDYLTGQPREFVDDANGGQNTQFIGRFIHEETSHGTFRYPFSLSNGNPVTRDPNDPAYVTPMVDQNQDGIVDRYVNGPRRAEDILMTHVHGFDVKVWDDALGQFVDVGHRVHGGDYHQTEEGNDPSGDADNRNLHLANGLNYGPHPPATATGPEPRNRVFDTWNPGVDIDGDGNPDPPPFRAMRPGPDGEPGVAGVDDDNDMQIDEPDEMGAAGSDDLPTPLRAIQITVRYHDVSSDQTRQLTLEFSLLD